MFVAFITLITRAVLESGGKEDLSYAMSDSYIQTVEKCTNVLQIKKLMFHALDYTANN